VLQRVAPALRRAEGVLAEAEQCRAAFPRITRARCTAGGDLELTFVDLAAERKVTVALTMAGRRLSERRVAPARQRRARRFAKAGAALARFPDAAVVEAAIERVPAGEAPRRLFGICRLVDWIVARGESGVADAAREAAAAARAPPPAPAPDVFLGAEGATLPAVARRGENSEDGEDGEGRRGRGDFDTTAETVGGVEIGSGSVADDERRGDAGGGDAGDGAAGCGRGCRTLAVFSIAGGFRADRLPRLGPGRGGGRGGAGERSAGGEDPRGVPEGEQPFV
jgi:hypothetical protein